MRTNHNLHTLHLFTKYFFYSHFDTLNIYPLLNMFDKTLNNLFFLIKKKKKLFQNRKKLLKFKKKKKKKLF
jgi:hypothetical protein